MQILPPIAKNDKVATTFFCHDLPVDSTGDMDLIVSCISSMRVSKIDKVFGVSDLEWKAVMGQVVVVFGGGWCFGFIQMEYTGATCIHITNDWGSNTMSTKLSLA